MSGANLCFNTKWLVEILGLKEAVVEVIEFDSIVNFTTRTQASTGAMDGNADGDEKWTFEKMKKKKKRKKMCSPLGFQSLESFETNN